MPAAAYFTDRSVIRRVHRERVMALAGPRALLLMAAHPVAFEGFFAHTGALGEPYERLRRTAGVLSVIINGPRTQADRATARVRAVHRTVRGELPEAAGPFPAGTRYAADDPELLLWILASLFHSSLLVHDRYVGSLEPDEREGYWSDYRLIGKLFGLRGREMPGDLAALEDYMHAMLDGPELFVTGRARELALRIVMAPPVPASTRPLLELTNFVTVGLLPRRLRREYGLSWDPARSLAVVGGAQYTRRVLIPLLPSHLRYVPRAAA